MLCEYISPRKPINLVGEFITLLLLLVCSFGCKKLIGVDTPITSTSANTVYKDDATAIAAVTDIYAKISNAPFNIGSFSSMSLFPALSADELALFSGATSVSYIGYYSNSLTNLNTAGADFWQITYPIIFISNSAIEGLEKSNSLTNSIKEQLIGEAKFIRAFSYFYLVNLYGDVPLVLNTDYKKTATLPRSAAGEVWQQIVSDLLDAQKLLNSNYLDNTLLNGSTERIRPCKWVATALLARVYLYMNDWKNAETQSSSIINNSLFSLNTLKNAFLKASLGNKEAIFQLQPVQAQKNTPDAIIFVIPATGPSASNPVYLSTSLLGSFQPNDQRKTEWIDSILASGKLYYFPHKYKINTLSSSVTEFEMILRLAEQYLIRAEARSHIGDLPGATSDLNVIRNRAGLLSASPTTQFDLLNEIQHERQRELFTEWGHRWLDLKRNNSVDSVMSSVASQKGGTWVSTSKWYPISLSELRSDPNLKQNDGY